jgi:hypothetical protein
MTTKEIGQKILLSPSSNMLKRMGLAGFSFFFIKGMLWVLIPILAHSALFN